MGALTRAAAPLAPILAVILALGPAPGLAAGEADWRVHVREAAARFGLPEDWVLRVIAAESGGRTHFAGKPITSRAGAMGLMQLMPATWAKLRARYGLGPDPHDPRDNIVAGAAYLREMYDRFGYPGLFAAYNAGPGRFGDYLARGRPLPRETRVYVARIVGAAAASPATSRWKVGALGDEGPAVDPIFLSRGRPRGGTPRLLPQPGQEALEDLGAIESGTAPRGEEGARIAAPTARSLFLLRKPAPSGVR